MKTRIAPKVSCHGSALLGYLFVALVVMATLAALGGLLVQNLNYSQRRQEIVNARQFAQAGAAICAQDVERAYTNENGLFFSNLTVTLTNRYAKNESKSTSSQWVYQRTISSPFTNQSVVAQIWSTNSLQPSKVKCVASATVGRST